ncbi:MAG: flagellar FliJ family protein [Planctomycetota bacterium]
MSGKKFRFRLDRVLDLRLATEREEAARFAVANRLANEAEERASESRRRAGEALAQLVEHSNDPASRIVAESLAAALDRRAALRAAAATEARDLADRAREQWIERRQDARALERLKESALAEHRAELERREEKDRDDRAAARFGREV